MDAAEGDLFEVPPPVAQADKRDIFRAYESALLRPAERCWEWELTDPRVRRVVSDAAEHFGSIAKMISCYRSPDYNKRLYTTKVKVKKRGKVRVVSRVLRLAYTSFHVKRMAIDFTVDGVARDLLAAFVRAHPLMQERGGVGRYANSDIIHIQFRTAPGLAESLAAAFLEASVRPTSLHRLRQAHRARRQGPRHRRRADHSVTPPPKRGSAGRGSYVPVITG